ncbi:hypothetical protein [Staphylococcus epidermidis]
MIDFEEKSKNNLEKLISVRRFILMIILTYFICSKYEKIIFNNLLTSHEIKVSFFAGNVATTLTILGIIINVLLVSLYELLLIFIDDSNKKGLILFFKIICALLLIRVYNEYLGLLNLSFFNALDKNIPLLFDYKFIYISFGIVYLLLLLIHLTDYLKSLKIFWKNFWKNLILFLKH